MRRLLISAAMFLAAQVANASSIDLEKTQLPWKNSAIPGSYYKMSDKQNAVHVIEAYSISCSWCNANAVQVGALYQEYAADQRVQFLDLGLDTRPQDYLRWISAHNPPYPVVQDVGQVVFKALKQENAIPQTFVMDCRGQLVGSTVGYWGEEEKIALRSAIAKALEITCK